MAKRATTLLLTCAVLAAAAGAGWLLLREPADVVPVEITGEGPDAASMPGVVAKARLTGAPVERKQATLEDLLASLSYEGGDADARDEIAMRAASQTELIAKLIAFLDLSYRELNELGLLRYQVLEALLAIGRPAAEPLARALFAPKRYGWGADILAVLKRMGGEAAPAVAVILERWPSVQYWQPSLIHILRSVGPEAAEALPLLLDAITPPVDDHLAPAAGAAVLAISGGSPEAIAAVRAMLFDEETLARPAMLSCIGMNPAGAEALVPVLVDLLHDPERPTQAAAAYALGRIGVANRGVLLGLVNLLADGTAEGQRRAAEALSALGEEGASLLAEVAREAADVDDRLAAFNGLIRTGVDTVPHVSVLLGILDEDVERGWKNRALGILSYMDPLPGPEVVLPHLVRALEDERLAQMALAVLCRLPGEDARAAIRAHLEATEDPQAAMKVIEGLARRRVAEPEATAMLLELARQENDAEMLSRVFLALAMANPKADAAIALPLIEPHLAAKGLGLRQSAWRALVAVEGEEERVFSHCLRAFSDDTYGPYACTIASQPLVRRPERASESVPALVAYIARSANESGYTSGVIVTALRRLAPHWAGTTKALDRAVAKANERGRTVLSDIRRRYSL